MSKVLSPCFCADWPVRARGAGGRAADRDSDWSREKEGSEFGLQNFIHTRVTACAVRIGEMSCAHVCPRPLLTVSGRQERTC